MASGGKDADKLSDETFDLLCTVCKHEGRNTEAVKYCTDCSDYYCSKCVKVHDTVPVLKGHKIVDKGQSQKGPSKPLPVVPTERCDRHGLKPVDMYCENHDGVGCSTCMTVEHRSCQGLYYIPEYIQNKAGVCKPTEIQRKLDSTGKALAENLRHFEQEKQQAVKKKAECIQNVRKFNKEINKRLDELEQASVDEIERKYQVMISKIEEGIQIMKKNNVRISSAEDKLASAGSNVSQVFVMTKTSHIVILDAEKCLEERRLETNEEDVCFISDQRLSNMLNELKVLGCSVHECSSRPEEKDTVVVKQKAALLQTKGMQKYPVKVQSDSKDCYILSSCVLENGTIILADNANKKLKRLDRSTYSVRDHYNLPWNPWQMCAINNQEVVVSYLQKEIMFISIANKMKQKSLFTTDFDCHGLGHANDKLYISDYKTSVYIYTVSGSKLQQFSKDHTGQPLFSGGIGQGIYSLTVNDDGSKIYVAHNGKGLIVLDRNGTVIGKFNGPELKIAYDVHLTSSGDVLVCGIDSNNILQLGPGGELKGEVLQSDGGKGGCKSFCCNQEISKMIVGRERNEIEVYDLVCCVSVKSKKSEYYNNCVFMHITQQKYSIRF